MKLSVLLFSFFLVSRLSASTENHVLYTNDLDAPQYIFFGLEEPYKEHLGHWVPMRVYEIPSNSKIAISVLRLSYNKDNKKIEATVQIGQYSDEGGINKSQLIITSWFFKPGKFMKVPDYDVVAIKDEAQITWNLFYNNEKTRAITAIIRNSKDDLREEVSITKSDAYWSNVTLSHLPEN
ncbi:MAG: hypothetical protein AAGA18_10415 [Verrucomicrobiota bacterium]